jgi:hypothetical protein
MQLQWDADLVEQAVFLEMRRRENLGATGLSSAYRRTLDALYELPQTDARETAFLRHHLKFFKKLGFEKFLLSLLDERPLIAAQVATVLFRKARGRNDEAAELFVRQTIRTVSVSLRAERFLDIPRLKAFLRHELMHVSDMLDPAFGYSPDIHLPGRPPAEEHILRERYRILWDTTIDGRLEREGRGLDTPKEKRLAEFNRAFVFVAEASRLELWDKLWNGERPPHNQLLSLACRARQLAPQHSTAATQPPPGAPCPLCQFPTFDWARPQIFSDELRLAIAKDFPRWSPEQGACDRCVEVYLAATHAAPLTRFLG